LPINASGDAFFDVVGQGVVLSKLIKKLWKSKLGGIPNSHTGAIDAAKTLGVTIAISPEELSDGTNNQELVIEFVWQIIRAYIFDTSVVSQDDLQRLLEPGEKLALIKPEQIFIRWFNFHLNNHGHHRTVSNFTSDIKDAENYAVLLNQIARDTVSSENLIEAFKEKDFVKRAEMVLRWAAKLGCKKFVSVQDIVNGNKDLNTAFVATLFRRYPALGPTSDEIATELQFRIDEAERLFEECLLDREDLETQIAQTKLDFDDLSKELGDLQLEFDSVSSEVDTLRTEKASLDSLLGDLTKENTQLNEECNTLTSETESLFAELESEISMKLDLETLLKETKEEFETLKSTKNNEISDLQKQLEEEINHKNTISQRLDAAKTELDSVRGESERIEGELSTRLQTEISKRQDVENKLNSAKTELEETLKLAEEVEQAKDDLFNLLSNTITDLETTKNNAKATEEELRNTLAEETAKKEAADQALKAKIQEYETALANWKVEREELLARIADLEGEIAALQQEMAEKLAAIAREKAEALERALSEKERALRNAENEKDMALDKVRMLLTGNTKQGYLFIQESTVLGMQWKKKFFILRDNLFCWYSKEKHVSAQRRPKGVIYCEEARVYDMPFEDAKREFAFQLDTGKARTNIAATSVEDMKDWMTQIRVAKKKKLGVKVVSDQKSKK